MTKAKIIKIYGREYTFVEASQAFNVSVDNLKYRWKRGYRDDKLVCRPNLKVKNYILYQGQKMTFTELSKVTGIPRGTIESRYGRGLRGEALVYNRKELVKRYATTALIKGETLTIKEISDRYHLSVETVKRRIKQEKTGDEIIFPSQSITKVNIDGHEYTLEELSNMSDINIGTLKSRLRSGWQGIDLISPIQYHRQEKIIIHNGKPYTYTQLAKKYNLSPLIVGQRYRAGKRGNELVAPRNKTNYSHRKTKPAIKIEYGGAVYTFKELADKTGIHINTLRRRYQDGWREAKLVQTPIKTSPKRLKKK